MKTYQPLECESVEKISAGIYKFLAEATDLLTTGAIGWHFLNHKELFAAVPELVKFFFKHKLIPNSASVVILEETGQLPLAVFTFHSESKDLDTPIVFNSRMPHEVVKIDGTSPRIIASFTFTNEPTELLK